MQSRLWLLIVWIGLLGVNGVCSKAPEVIPLSPKGYKKLIRQHRGHVVVVNIWSTYCDPCREEFPDFLSVYERYKNQNVDFLFISIDWPEDMNRVFKFLEKQHVRFRTYIKDGKDMEFIEAVSPRWSGAIPATLIYDEEGRLRVFREGLLTRDKLEVAIKRLKEESLHRKR